MEKSFNPKGVKKKPLVSKKMVFFVIVPIALVILLIAGGRRLTWKEIQADEVAVIINNITGNIKTIDRAGAVVYYPFIQDLYILDKREQEAPMTSSNISADFPQGNPIILKTRDGGDVSIDLIIQYKLISKMADKIVQDTGIGEEYKEKWIWDYARTICRYEFGDLIIGEFPDSAKRDEKIRTSTSELNNLLNPHGILVTSLNFIDYRYYREYAEKIHERRLADKEVEEQVQRASAARENQNRVVTEETKKLEVAVSRFGGTLHQMEIDARAEADRIKDAGRAYLIKSILDADAEYDRLEKEAASILAVKKAEAEGIFALKKALEGAGGRNLVKMEYAKRLRNASIIGTPVLRAGQETPQVRFLDRVEAIRSEVREVEAGQKEEGETLHLPSVPEERMLREQRGRPVESRLQPESKQEPQSKQGEIKSHGH
ncbi:MAG: SPFH domain-containing protein [Candidatus Scalindua sp.]|nr:SPFH domain-containing protein [Candidatus Scalindua sp.]MCR4345107.1 SPFH domain-containing protein [Candidatus Scalindua sp.]